MLGLQILCVSEAKVPDLRRVVSSLLSLGLAATNVPQGHFTSALTERR